MRKILIHALGAEMGGAMRHLNNFLPELVKQDQRNHYVVLAKNSFPEIHLANKILIERLSGRKSSGWLDRIYLDNIVIPRRIKKEHFDLLVTLTNFGPIKAPCPHILFQRNSIYFCRYYLERIKGKLKAEVLLRQKFAVEAMKRADLIVTPSNAMTNIIKETCPNVRNRSFKTLYHGFEKNTLHMEPLHSKYAKLLSDKRIKLLSPTHIAAHKGFEELFEIFAYLKKRRSDFVLYITASHVDWPEGIRKYLSKIEQLGLQDHIVFTGRIPQGQIGHLYNHCDLMIYPSLCESFGFSMIEALGHGLPIVAADTEVNHEICGDGALYYSPTNYVNGADKIDKALDPELRKRLADTGRMRFESFDWTWHRYVRNFIEIINRVV